MGKFIGCFSPAQLIELTNKTLKDAGKRIKIESVVKMDGGYDCIMKNSRGTRYFVQFYVPYQTGISVRAIHRIKDRWRSFTFLYNGQGGKNLETLVFQGEQGELQWATPEQYYQFCKASLPESKTEVEVENYFQLMSKGINNHNPHFI